jgi:hypothetical protein
MNRDRDDDGRPRNARARDAQGRPLPRGQSGYVETDPVATNPDVALRDAQQLLDDGRAFRAHEVLETMWKAADESSRALWRGLAQLAVGITHAQRGNAAGASSLLRRCAQTLAPYAGTRPHGVDVDGLREWAAVAVAEPRLMTHPPQLREQR